MTRTRSRREKSRYRPALWAHGPKLVEHTPDGEKWRGFAAAKELDEVSPGTALISLPGHTRGHVCVAVDAGRRWLLHCGDAYFHHGTVDGTAAMPRALDAFERVTAFDRKMMQDNHARLTELYRRGEPTCSWFAHMTGSCTSKPKPAPREGHKCRSHCKRPLPRQSKPCGTN